MNDLDLWELLVFYKCVSVQAEIVAAAVFVTNVCHCHNDIFFTPTYPAASQIYPCICLVAERASFNSLSCDPLLFLHSQKIGRLRIVIIMFLCFCNSFITSQKMCNCHACNALLWTEGFLRLMMKALWHRHYRDVALITSANKMSRKFVDS